MSQCCFKPKTDPTGGEKGVPVLLSAKKRTTGGEKGVPVELRLRVPREEKKVSQCCFKPKTDPQEEKKVSQCCFQPKTEPQEEKKGSQSVRSLGRARQEKFYDLKNSVYSRL